MIVRAEHTYARQTPTRLRLVAEAIKKMKPAVAMEQLEFMNKKAARTILVVFKQAMANAVNNLGLSADTLVIKDIVIGEGPRYKRFQAVSRGRAHSILKRTSHIRVLLETVGDVKVTKKKAEVKAAPKKDDGAVVETVSTKQENKPMIVGAQKPTVKPQTTVKTVTVRKTGER